jgi:ribosomal protein L40E
MRYFRKWMSSLRAWVERARGDAPFDSVPVLDALLASERPLFREVSAHGVRVYSLCVSCGAHLAASATLCDACARRRTISSS